jgi:uncharacterized Fe-S cluster-containing radical SAM superfamily protein
MKLTLPFDPLERSGEVEQAVMKDGRRMYYRFRSALYYGGIATADAIGCSFLCAYCWNYFRNLNPARFDKFYSPHQVASNMLRIARKRSFHLFRITGSEPVLGESSFKHLLDVIEIIFKEMPRSIFILETNGLFLGYRIDLIEKMKFRNLWIRISLKGVDEESFESISGAKREFFEYPLRALRELENQGLKVWPAVMRNLFTENEIAGLSELLTGQKIGAGLEEEFLEGYPFVIENMKRRGVEIKR